MFPKVTLLFIGAVITNCGAFVEIKTFHLADYIEFHSSLAACEESVVNDQQIQFSNCVAKNLTKQSENNREDISGFYSLACLNEDAYKKCWDPVILQSKECNSANGKGYPTSFSSVIKAVCKNDNGKSFLLDWDKAVEASKNEKEEDCTASGDHWIIACKDFDITSRNVCKKHTEMSKCVETITCKEHAMGRLFSDIYDEAGKIAGCTDAKHGKAKSKSIGHHKRRGLYFIVTTFILWIL